jgi:hypothetical protein
LTVGRDIFEGFITAQLIKINDGDMTLQNENFELIKLIGANMVMDRYA